MTAITFVDKVNFIIGGICSSETLVGKDLIESSETLTISPCASSPDLKNIKNYIFSLYPLDNLDGKLSAEYIYNVLSKRKAAIFSCQSDWCLGEKTIFKERFSELGGTITIIEHNTTDESDLRSYLIKINNGDAEIIFAPQYVGGQEKLFEQAKEINLKQTIFVPSLLDKDLVAKLGSISDNIYGTVLKTSETNTLFSDELKQRTGMIKIDSDLCGNRAYDSLMLLNEAIINTKNIDTNKIIDYLHDIDYLGLSGKIQFDKEGMILNGNFVIVKTKNGKLIEQK